MKIRDAMSKHVTTVEAQATIAEAARTMKQANVGFLPVMNVAGKPIGVITDRDIALRSVADGIPTSTPVEKAMSYVKFMLEENADLQTALDLMKEKQVGRVLVTDRGGSLVGILSLNDAAVACKGDGRTARVHEALRSRTAKTRASRAAAI